MGEGYLRTLRTDGGIYLCRDFDQPLVTGDRWLSAVPPDLVGLGVLGPQLPSHTVGVGVSTWFSGVFVLPGSGLVVSRSGDADNR